MSQPHSGEINIGPRSDASMSGDSGSGYQETEAKKLCLILDLDHTLLETAEINELKTKEQYLSAQVNGGVDNGSLFVVESMGEIAKLRPFARCFLEEASKMFKMYIYTDGNKKYALEMAKLLDPEGKYFDDGRVFSREDPRAVCTKRLEVVGVKETDALIVDDCGLAWWMHEDNLIQIEPYCFFAKHHRLTWGLNRKSYSEKKTDEAEDGGALQVVLGVLRRVHRHYNTAEGGDVRPVLDAARKEVLKGCSLVLEPWELVQHRDLAERFGARCSLHPDPSATHVVPIVRGTVRCKWGRETGKLVVNGDWLLASCYKWQKQPEAQYSLVQHEESQSRRTD